MIDAEADVIRSVTIFLHDYGYTTRNPGTLRLEVVNRDSRFPVTIRFGFMGGDFVGTLAGTTDLLGDVSQHLRSGGGLELRMNSHQFEISDPEFFDHVLNFVQNPYEFLEK